MDTVRALKSMAIDPKKRLALAKDSTCMGGLVLVLSNSDSRVVVEALQTFLLLCESSSAKACLQHQVGLLDQLETLVARRDKEGEVNHLAKVLLSKLEDEEDVQTPLRDTSNISRNNCHTGRSRVKTIILQLKGFQDKSDQDLCARLLLKTKGVISITFDLLRKRCILHTKGDVKPEVLAASVAMSMTMTAQQVVRNSLGEESLVSFNLSHHSESSNKQEQQDLLPEYLPDDAELTMIDDRAMKKPSEEDRKRSSSWFSAAASFLTNSFYW